MAGFPPESNAVSGGYYMNNLVSIAQYLMANGFSRAAAAGVAGTIAGESTGNPESVGSGGAGLIGWTPPSSASPDSNIITGNPNKDFDTQLTDLLAYANANSQEAIARGGVDLATLKKSTDPQQAASYWTAFEGPLVPGSDIRSGVVNQVYSALSGYSPNQGYKTAAGAAAPSSGGGGGGGGLISFPSQITDSFSEFDSVLKMATWMFQPSSWLRIVAFLAGTVLLLFGLHAIISANSGEPIVKMPDVVPVPV